MAKKLIRRGRCKQCGQCCKLKNLLSTESNRWVRFNYLGVEDLDSVVCKHLRFIDGKAVCTLFGKSDRPLACLLYPTSPKDLLPGCGYYFVEEDI